MKIVEYILNQDRRMAYLHSFEAMPIVRSDAVVFVSYAIISDIDTGAFLQLPLTDIKFMDFNVKTNDI